MGKAKDPAKEWPPCPVCYGTGRAPNNKTGKDEICAFCDGRG